MFCTDAGLMVAVVIGVVLGILVGAFMLVGVFVFRQRSVSGFRLACWLRLLNVSNSS